MWKKQDDDVGAQPEFASKQTPELESLGDAPIESLVDSRFEIGISQLVPRRLLPKTTIRHRRPQT